MKNTFNKKKKLQLLKLYLFNIDKKYKNKINIHKYKKQYSFEIAQ